MRITVKLFGQERQALGTDTAPVDVVTERVTCAELRDRLAESHPAIAERLPWCRFAINYEFASDDTAVHVDDEVALIGAVSGG